MCIPMAPGCRLLFRKSLCFVALDMSSFLTGADDYAAFLAAAGTHREQQPYLVTPTPKGTVPATPGDHATPPLTTDTSSHSILRSKLFFPEKNRPVSKREPGNGRRTPSMCCANNGRLYVATVSSPVRPPMSAETIHATDAQQSLLNEVQITVERHDVNLAANLWQQKIVCRFQSTSLPTQPRLKMKELSDVSFLIVLQFPHTLMMAAVHTNVESAAAYEPEWVTWKSQSNTELLHLGDITMQHVHGQARYDVVCPALVCDTSEMAVVRVSVNFNNVAVSIHSSDYYPLPGSKEWKCDGKLVDCNALSYEQPTVHADDVFERLRGLEGVTLPAALRAEIAPTTGGSAALQLPSTHGSATLPIEHITVVVMALISNIVVVGIGRGGIVYTHSITANYTIARLESSITDNNVILLAHRCTRGERGSVVLPSTSTSLNGAIEALRSKRTASEHETPANNATEGKYVAQVESVELPALDVMAEDFNIRKQVAKVEKAAPIIADVLNSLMNVTQAASKNRMDAPVKALEPSSVLTETLDVDYQAWKLPLLTNSKPEPLSLRSTPLCTLVVSSTMNTTIAVHATVRENVLQAELFDVAAGCIIGEMHRIKPLSQPIHRLHAFLDTDDKVILTLVYPEGVTLHEIWLPSSFSVPKKPAKTRLNGRPVTGALNHACVLQAEASLFRANALQLVADALDNLSHMSDPPEDVITALRSLGHSIIARKPA